jgi:hypothetical protein
MVASAVEDPSAERGGNPRKRFSVTADGLVALRRSRSVVSRLSAGLDDFLEAAK